MLDVLGSPNEKAQNYLTQKIVHKEEIKKRLIGYTPRNLLPYFNHLT